MAPSAIAIEPEYSAHVLTDVNLVSICHGATSSNGLKNAKAMVYNTLREKIAQIDVDSCKPGEEDAFYVADLGQVYRQHLRWKMNLSRVKPFYGECSEEAPSRWFLTRCSREMQPRSRSFASNGETGYRL